MVSLLLKITPQALGSAVSPTVFAVTMLILGSKSRPRARTAAYLTGALIVLILIGAIDLFVVHTAPASVGTKHSPLEAILNIVLGLGLLALGARTVLSHPDKTAEAKNKRSATQPRLLTAIGLGVVMMATNFSTLILYIAAVKDVRYAKVDALMDAGALAYLILFATLPIVLPLVGSIVAPGPTQKTLGRLDGLAKTHSKQIGVVVCAIFGVYLLAKGVAAL